MTVDTFTIPSVTDNFCWEYVSLFCATNYFHCRLIPRSKSSLLQIISLAEYFLFEALPIIYFLKYLFPVPFQYFSPEYFRTRILFSLKLWHLILICWLHWCFDVTSNFSSSIFPTKYFFYFRVIFYQVVLLFMVLPLALFFTSELSLSRILSNILLVTYFSW